jgi:hypothetical protein
MSYEMKVLNQKMGKNHDSNLKALEDFPQIYIKKAIITMYSPEIKKKVQENDTIIPGSLELKDFYNKNNVQRKVHITDENKNSYITSDTNIDIFRELYNCLSGNNPFIINQNNNNSSNNSNNNGNNNDSHNITVFKKSDTLSAAISYALREADFYSRFDNLSDKNHEFRLRCVKCLIELTRHCYTTNFCKINEYGWNLWYNIINETHKLALILTDTVNNTGIKFENHLSSLPLLMPSYSYHLNNSSNNNNSNNNNNNDNEFTTSYDRHQVAKRMEFLSNRISNNRFFFKVKNWKAIDMYMNVIYMHLYRGDTSLTIPEDSGSNKKRPSNTDNQEEKHNKKQK